MLFKILLFCDEVENFRREIMIDADASFLDLNKAILNSCGYPDDQITSFYTCNDDWEEEDQITREDMGVGAADRDIYIMEKAILRDFIHDEDQKLIFVFDPFNDRVFYMTVSEIVTGKTLKAPECIVSKGKAPQQIESIDTPSTSKSSSIEDTLLNDSEDFFGSDEFDQEDFDPEGFEIEEH